MNTITKLLLVFLLCLLAYWMYVVVWVQPCVMKYPGVTRPEFPPNYREMYLDN